MPPRPSLPEPFVFFVDECLGRTVVPDAVRRACSPGETVVTPPQGVLDAQWIIEAGEAGWVCFSKDRQMMKRPIERDAIVYSRIALFLVREGNGAEHARVIGDALPFVRQLARELERSFVARIEVDNKITILVKSGARLEHPETIKTHKKALKALKSR